MDNKWETFDLQQVEMLENAANSLKRNGYALIDEILDTFERVGLPLIYNAPGFYGKFCADCPARIEDIENFCFDHD